MATTIKIPALLSGAAFGLALIFTGAGHTTAQTASQQEQSIPQDEFTLRTEMMKALEETKDDARLNALIQADPDLYSYSLVLHRAALYLKDQALVKKLLDMPDQTSPAYKRAVGSVISFAGANEKQTDMRMMNILFDRIKDDAREKTHILSFIFQTVAENPQSAIDANVEVTRMLIENGADIASATKYPEAVVNGQLTQAQRKVREFKAFKDAVAPRP